LQGPATEAEDQQILLALWDLEVWRMGDQGDEDREPVPDKLAYELAQRLAKLTLSGPSETCERFWRPVLALGPRAHYLVGRFISSLFLGNFEKTDAGDFGQRWQAMLSFALAQDEWMKGRGWSYAHTIFRQLLGFGYENQLVQIRGHERMIFEARASYTLWVEKYLPQDEDNLGALCSFLQSDAGTADFSSGFLVLIRHLGAQSSRAQPHEMCGRGDSKCPAKLWWRNPACSVPGFDTPQRQ
jgi:hypothetical protein